MDIIGMLKEAFKATDTILEKYVPGYKSTQRRKYNELKKDAMEWLKESEEKEKERENEN